MSSLVARANAQGHWNRIGVIMNRQQLFLLSESPNNIADQEVQEWFVGMKGSSKVGLGFPYSITQDNLRLNI